MLGLRGEQMQVTGFIVGIKTRVSADPLTQPAALRKASQRK